MCRRPWSVHTRSTGPRLQRGSLRVDPTSPLRTTARTSASKASVSCSIPAKRLFHDPRTLRVTRHRSSPSRIHRDNRPRDFPISAVSISIAVRSSPTCCSTTTVGEPASSATLPSKPTGTCSRWGHAPPFDRSDNMLSHPNPFLHSYQDLRISRSLFITYEDDCPPAWRPLHPSQAHLSDGQVARFPCIFNDDFALVTEGQEIPDDLVAQCQSEGLVRAVTYAVNGDDFGQPVHIGDTYSEEAAREVVQRLRFETGVPRQGSVPCCASRCAIARVRCRRTGAGWNETLRRIALSSPHAGLFLFLEHGSGALPIPGRLTPKRTPRWPHVRWRCRQHPRQSIPSRLRCGSSHWFLCRSSAYRAIHSTQKGHLPLGAGVPCFHQGVSNGYPSHPRTNARSGRRPCSP